MQNTNPKSKIFKADPDYRKRTIILMILLTIVGLIFLSFMQTHLNGIIDLTEENLDAARSSIIKYLYIGSFILISTSIAFSISFYQKARSIKSHGQFPAPGMKVLKDVPIKSGAASRPYYLSMIFSSILILAMGILIPVIFSLLFLSMK